MADTQEVMELSLEKVIESKLVQNNVTQQVLTALKDKYGGLKLKALDDKESYLEIKAAARECAKVRTLTVKICKEGREEAVKTQKLWIAKEKEIVAEVDTVESALDAETALYDNEVKRKEQEEIKRKEEAYINRQAVLNKMGARYEVGSFVLGEASFEADLVKGMDEEIWNNDVVPKFQAEYEKIEAIRITAEKEKAEREEAFRQEQEKMRKEQEEMTKQREEIRVQQEQLQKQQAEQEKAKREAEHQEELRKRETEEKLWRGRLSELNEIIWNGQEAVDKFYDTKVVVTYEQLIQLSDKDWFKIRDEHNAFSKERLAMQEEEKRKEQEDKLRIATEQAASKERERIAEEQRQTEIKKKQDEERKQAELEAAGDKTKWEEFIREVKELPTFDMRSGQYRKKMQIAKEKLEEILAL